MPQVLSVNKTDILVCGEGVIEKAKNKKYKQALKFRGLQSLMKVEYRKSYLGSSSSETTPTEEKSVPTVDLEAFYSGFSKAKLQKILTSLGRDIKKSWKTSKLVEKNFRIFGIQSFGYLYIHLT